MPPPPPHRLGFTLSHPQLWGQHGYASRRLPTSSAAAIYQQLDAAWERMDESDWAERAEADMDAALEKEELRGFLRIVALMKGRLEMMQQEWRQRAGLPATEEEPEEHGSLAANALVAAGVLAACLAGAVRCGGLEGVKGWACFHVLACVFSNLVDSMPALLPAFQPPACTCLAQ